MMLPLQHRAVNWVDGMKISRRHFQETENYLRDHIRDTTSLFLSDYNFGLLPPYKEGKSTKSNDFELAEKITNEIEVRLKTCHAITPGGCRIAIENEGIHYLTFNQSFGDRNSLTEDRALDGKEEVYDLLLIVNPFDPVPYGSPDPEETPPRHPYSTPKYELKLLHSSNTNTEFFGAHHLLIGKIIYRGGKYHLDETYIPPCTSMESHPLLIKYYERYRGLVNDLQQNSLRIIHKIHLKNRPSDIAKNVKMLCETLLDYIATAYFSYKTIGHRQPPVYTVEKFSTLSNLIYTRLHCLPEREKEELLKYFLEWTDITPSIFLNMLSACIEINYNHYNVGECMSTVRQFLEVTDTIWEKLNTLEYIGQRRENIVVKEEVLAQAVKEKKGWSILD